MFEQTFKNIDDILHKDAGCSSELDYTEQTSWMLFLKYLDDFETDRSMEAELMGENYQYIIDEHHRWGAWAAPKDDNGSFDHNNALTGDDLIDYVDDELFPYLKQFKQRADNANTIEYKIGEIFGEIKNKIQSGYSLRDALEKKEKSNEYEKYQLHKNDIVLAMDRTWVKAGIKFSKISKEDLPALLAQRVARLRCLDSLNSDYLYHLIGSKLFESHILSIQTGLGVPHINGKQIQAFEFSLPPLGKQLEIVETLNKLATEVSRLYEVYQEKLIAVDELKKSLLQKAFSGELTKALDADNNKGAAA